MKVKNDKNGSETKHLKLETIFLQEKLPKPNYLNNSMKRMNGSLRMVLWIVLFQVLKSHKKNSKQKLFRLLTGQFFFLKLHHIRIFEKSLLSSLWWPNLQHSSSQWNNNKILIQNYMFSCFIPFLPRGWC